MDVNPSVKLASTLLLVVLSGCSSISHTPPQATVASGPEAHQSKLDAWLIAAQEAGLAEPIGEDLARGVGQRAILSNTGISIGENRIVGGELFSGLPAVGALLYSNGIGPRHPHCTGTLIDSQTVLTAAHCVAGFDPTRMVFAMGPTAWTPLSTYRVRAFEQHEQYTSEPLGTHDIALVYLAQAVSESQPIALPPAAAAVEDALRQSLPLTFVGYGYAVQRSSGIKYRLGFKARVDIQPSSYDERTLRYGEPGKGTCNGDSGGPAMLVNPVDASMFIVGITSWGDSACLEFGVNMRVDAYLPWIHARMGGQAPPSSKSRAPLAHKGSSGAKSEVAQQ